MPDIREALEAAIEQHAPETTTAQSAVVTESEPAVVEAPKAEASSTERARDEKGRFTQAQQDEIKAVAEHVKATQKQQAAPAQAAPAVPVKAFDPPKSWKKEYHEVFKTLDPRAQEYVTQREAEAEKGIVSYAQKAKLAEEFEQTVTPYLPTLQQLGVSPIQAVKALMDADHRLRSSDPATKAQLFAQLAQTYGVSLENVQQPPQVDPSVAHLQSQVQSLTNVIQQLQAQESAKYVSEIDQFRSTHEHLDAVREDMALLLQSGKATTLDQAYSMAIRLNDELFEQTQAAQRQAEEQRRIQEAQAATARAKAAAVQVRGAPVTSVTGNPKSIREALEQAISLHS